MPYASVDHCPECAFDVEVLLCREFERLPDGARRDYQYPDPALYEWPPRRVSGVWSRLWCPSCREVQPHVLHEMDEPAEHPAQVFLAAEAQGLRGLESGPCPVCGATLCVELENQRCPACENSTLTCIGEYEP